MRSTVSPESAVRRSVSLPAEIAGEVNNIAEARRVSQNRALVHLISDGIAAYRQRRVEFFASRPLPSVDRSGRNGEAPGRTGSRDFWRLMPKIQWLDLPASLRRHLFDRAKEREISMQDIFALEEWRKNFGSFKLCGEGKYPKTFLLKGQAAFGEELE
jgi:hypothetical protein